MILLHSYNQILKYVEHMLQVREGMEDLEFKFYNIFGHLMRFCTRVNYFENMKPFADKTQFTEQNL